MSAVFRVGIVRLSGLNPCATLLNTQSLLPAALNQKCTIMGRAMRGGPRRPKQPPFPYKTKKYNLFASWFDKTSKRFDENTKLICIEGPIASGKSKFAAELAEELDMLYMPQATLDSLYINAYGYDLRQLDPQLPPGARSFDIEKFCRDPKHKLAARFQIMTYQERFSQYIDALQHILSTGQGVVLERSCYSDFVFVEAMTKAGFMSQGARKAYYEIRDNTIDELLKPHLVIYLDLPVDVVKQRIKARNIDYEVNSPAFTDDYLKTMEETYKQQFLKAISTHAEILIYDWTAGGETEVVVEDIERIDFDVFEQDHHNKKMKDWRFPLEHELAEARIEFCYGKPLIMNYFNVPVLDVPELILSAEDSKTWNDIWYNAPGMQYRPGYNADMGDKGLLTKTKVPFNEPLI